MAVSFKASLQSAGIAGINLTLNYVASKAAGDLALGIIETGNTAAFPSLAGFTQGGRSGAGANGSGTNATQIAVFTRILDGSEGASAAFTGGADHCVGIMLLYNGFDPRNPVSFSAGTSSAVAQTSVNSGPIAQKQGDGDDMFLACYAWDRDAATASARTNSNFANLNGETITNRANTGTGSNAGGGHLIEEGDPASDSVGAVTHSVDFTSSIWAGILLRINALKAFPPLVIPSNMGVLLCR